MALIRILELRAKGLPVSVVGFQLFSDELSGLIDLGIMETSDLRKATLSLSM